jgi:hypothetical protein
MSSSRQLLKPRQELEISRERELFAASGQRRRASEAAVACLIDIEEDLHTVTVRSRTAGVPRGNA